MPTPTPRFRELNAAECTAILDRHNVGRLAFAHKDHVDITPIHYVNDGEWLYGRTQPGAKLEALTRNRWVAFEVDEVDALFDWRSVVVKGGVYLLRHDGSEQEQATYAHGVEVLRRLVPETLTPDDPLPERAIILRIHKDEVTGRAASTR